MASSKVLITDKVLATLGEALPVLVAEYRLNHGCASRMRRREINAAKRALWERLQRELVDCVPVTELR